MKKLKQLLKEGIKEMAGRGVDKQIVYKRADIYGFLKSKEGYGVKVAQDWAKRMGVEGVVTLEELKDFFFSSKYIFKMPALVDVNIKKLQHFVRGYKK